MHFNPCPILFHVLLPVPASAREDYPPNIPDAEAILFKTIGDVTLKLYVFKPEGWKATDKRPVVVFSSVAAGITEALSISCRNAKRSAGGVW